MALSFLLVLHLKICQGFYVIYFYLESYFGIDHFQRKPIAMIIHVYCFLLGLTYLGLGH